MNSQFQIQVAYCQPDECLKLLDWGQATLPEEFLRETESLSHREDRVLRILGRALVVLTMSERLNVPPDQITLSYEQGGRPQRIRNESVSISHTDGAVCVAIAHGMSVGIDVERVRNLALWPPISPSALTDAEFQWMQQIPDELRSPRFFDWWVRKEALAKAVGCGIDVDLKNFTFSLTDHRTRTVEIMHGKSVIPDQWLLKALDLIPGCAAAIAYEGPDREVYCARITDGSFASLISEQQ